ncbi:MAG TPA: hypothetical protein VHZ74_05525 [Bryobacteraceae bacterium]|jgi:heme/copper-type cytochrome/quinol oxidase subunit 2|nr:hypothetical protein [Bryobacteraceae bacterium]
MLTSTSAVIMVRIVAGIFALVTVVIILFRRNSEPNKKEKEDEF